MQQSFYYFHRIPILFGENLRVGCTFTVTRSALSSTCESLKSAALKLLVGPAADADGDSPAATLSKVRVGAFGDASAENEDEEWVPLLVENAPLQGSEVPPTAGGSTEGSQPTPPSSSSPSFPDGVCPNMVLSTHIEVAYALVGSLADPQAKIVGAKMDFGAPRDVRFRCLGSACDGIKGKGDDPRMEVELSSSVSFVDLTRPALEKTAEFPVIEAKFPYDFFYPFVGDYYIYGLGGKSGGGGGGKRHFSRALLFASVAIGYFAQFVV